MILHKPPPASSKGAPAGRLARPTLLWGGGEAGVPQQSWATYGDQGAQLPNTRAGRRRCSGYPGPGEGWGRGWAGRSWAGSQAAAAGAQLRLLCGCTHPCPPSRSPSAGLFFQNHLVAKFRLQVLPSGPPPPPTPHQPSRSGRKRLFVPWGHPCLSWKPASLLGGGQARRAGTAELEEVAGSSWGSVGPHGFWCWTEEFLARLLGPGPQLPFPQRRPPPRPHGLGLSRSGSQGEREGGAAVTGVGWGAPRSFRSARLLCPQGPAGGSSLAPGCPGTSRAVMTPHLSGSEQPRETTEPGAGAATHVGVLSLCSGRWDPLSPLPARPPCPLTLPACLWPDRGLWDRRPVPPTRAPRAPSVC